MKRVLKYFLLILMFIPFIKVKAYVTINISLASNNPHDIYWFAPLSSRSTLNALKYLDGNVRVVNGEGVIHYQTKLYEGSTGKSGKFTAVCIDPGMKHSSGTFNCSEYKNADMVGLFEKYSSSNDATFITAVRIKAKRQSITTPSYANAMEVFDNNFSNFGEGDKDTVKKGVRSPDGVLSNALEMANKTYGEGKVKSSSSAKFTTSVSSYSGNSVTLDISSDKELKGVPQIECTYGCEGKPTVSWGANAKSGKVTLKVKVPNPCQARLKIKYLTLDGESSHLYYCSPSGTTPIPGASSIDEQKFLAYIPDKALNPETSVTGGDKPGSDNSSCEGCTEDTIEVDLPSDVKKAICDDKDCECKIKTEKVKNIHFCCSESTTSKVDEPKINEIFCTKKEKCGSAYNINVPGANDKETGNVVSDLYDVPGTSYCRVYCTERITVDIPGALKGHNGRYFKLEGAGGEKGPVISGSYGCRNVIDYDEWLMDYIDLSERAVDAHNTYQKYRAYYDLYKKAFDDTKTGSSSYKIKYSYSKELDYTDAAGNVHSCTITDSNDCTVTFDYVRHLETSLSANYLTAKIKYENDKNTVEGFSKFEIVKDSKNSVSTKTGYYHISNESECSAPGASEQSCKIKASDICMDKACTTHATKDEELTDTPEYSSEKSERPDDIQSDVDAYYPYENTPTTYIKNKSDSYNKLVSEIKDKKDEIDKCDNYFDKNSDDYKNFLMKKFQVPSVTFQWFFTYISVDSVVQPKINEVVYKLTEDSGSNCGLSADGEWTGGTDSETGVEAPHIDELNKANPEGKYITFAKTIDFNNVSDCNNDADNCSGGLSETKINKLRGEFTAPQKYTSDTKFNYSCKYEPSTSATKYTVYPYGGFSLSQSNDVRAYTQYDNQLYVEYSTLSGRYETNWLFSHLGSKRDDGSGKFDEDFTNGQDCTGNNPDNDTPMLSCELSVSRTLTKIKGCRDIASIFDNGSNWSKKCCKEGTDCKVLTDDVLSFSFKVVDSNIIFPGTKRTGSDNSYQSSDKPKGYSLGEDGKKSTEEKGYAANWFDDDIARSNLKYIEDHSGNDIEFSPDRLTYRFNLTSTAITAIRKYNHLEKNEFNRLNGEYEVTTDDYVGKYESKFISNYYDGYINAPDKINLKNNTNGGATARTNARKKVVWASEKAEDKS